MDAASRSHNSFNLREAWKKINPFYSCLARAGTYDLLNYIELPRHFPKSCWPAMLSFRPKLLDTLKGYSRQDFFADLVAGFTVGIVALPLAMAFAIASGVDPKAGLYTAIIAGFLISALGGSKVQVGGPTGAFVAIIYGIVAHRGLDHL